MCRGALRSGNAFARSSWYLSSNVRLGAASLLTTSAFDANVPDAVPTIGLVVGLGNPEPRYRRTRHNAGQLVVERLAERLSLRFASKYAGRFTQGRGPGGPVSLLIPTTYMNLSGQSVSPAVGSLHLDLAQVIVVHDELDLPFGTVRGKVGGGPGGHNGLRSIQTSLGNPGFGRIRLGIGRPPAEFRGDQAAWVLGGFGETDDDVEQMIVRGVEMVEFALASGLDAAIATFHASEPGARRRARQDGAAVNEANDHTSDGG